MTVSVPAYAKINLFLDVVSVREDGYHNILSIMQSVSLHDTVKLEYEASQDKNIRVFCNRSDIPCGSDNLAYKAAAIYPIRGNIIIEIDKNIPMSAGLAGGSADAAATLIALNSVSDSPLSVDELCALGAELGADVPFCIKKGACLVEGIGERLSAISSMPAFPIVIAKKGEGMSTPAAYRALDQKYNRFVDYNPKEELCRAITSATNTENAKSFCRSLYNIFESVVEPERPAVTEIKKAMLSCGAEGVLMSGSGTSVFGIYSNVDGAEKAVKLLKKAGADAHLCYPM